MPSISILLLVRDLEILIAQSKLVWAVTFVRNDEGHGLSLLNVNI